MRLVKAAIVLACVVLPTTARAQVVFPPDSAFSPLRCGKAPMGDLVADQAGALDDRDIVGDAAAPAGLRASDTTNLYLRLRVESDPAPGGVLRASAWGMELDLDGDRSSYELLIAADGIGAAGAVSLYRNTVVTQRGDPRDPADLPAAATFPFAMNGRVVAVNSNFGNDGDYFVDFAVPWSELARVGLDRTTTTYVWAGTSSTATALDADLACHDGATGAPVLDTTASDQTTGDPVLDPVDPVGGAGELEGGGGCSAGGPGAGAGSAALLGTLAALGLVALPRLRRRRRAR